VPRVIHVPLNITAKVLLQQLKAVNLSPSLCKAFTVSQILARLLRFSVNCSGRTKLEVPTLMTCPKEWRQGQLCWSNRQY
jgi:hypothetical protein